MFGSLRRKSSDLFGHSSAYTSAGGSGPVSAIFGYFREPSATLGQKLFAFPGLSPEALRLAVGLGGSAS